jgi:sugar phosphate permease
MSEEAGFGLGFAERVFGLVILLVGGVTAYYTFVSVKELAGFEGFFVFLSIILIVLGLVLMTAKTEE